MFNQGEYRWNTKSEGCNLGVLVHVPFSPVKGTCSVHAMGRAHLCIEHFALIEDNGESLPACSTGFQLVGVNWSNIDEFCSKSNC